MNIALLAALFLLVVNLIVYAAQGYSWLVVAGWIVAIYATWRFRAWSLQ